MANVSAGRVYNIPRHATHVCWSDTMATSLISDNMMLGFADERKRI
jgi:hypothetical protein